jgi:dienelactone hydrolase
MDEHTVLYRVQDLRWRRTSEHDMDAIHVYAGTQHAFNNDTGGARYNKAAAELAWGRTLAFFVENLGAPPKAA